MYKRYTVSCFKENGCNIKYAHTHTHTHKHTEWETIDKGRTVKDESHVVEVLQ